MASGKVFATALRKGRLNETDWEAGAVKVALLDNVREPDIDVDEFFADLGNEVVHASYPAGGVALANPIVNHDTADDAIQFDADDTVFTALAIAYRWAVVYRDTGNPATSPLLAKLDPGSLIDAGGNDYTFQWGADGIVQLDG